MWAGSACPSDSHALLQSDWSQETLAEIGGLRRTYISGIDHTERNIGLNNVGTLAAAFGLPIAELLA